VKRFAESIAIDVDFSATAFVVGVAYHSADHRLLVFLGPVLLTCYLLEAP
jgi:hypothetical protein